MLLQVLLRALTESSHAAHEGSPLQGRSPGPACSSGYLGDSALVSVGPGALPFPSGSRACWKALEPAPPPLLCSPGYKRRGCPTRVQLCSAPPITCSLGLRAWHGTYRASAMSTTGPGWGTRPWRVRQAPPPEQQQMGSSGPCSPEPWPTSWGCSEPYCTSFVSSSSTTTHFPLKKKKREGLEEWGVETGALLPTFMPPSGPQQSRQQ